MPIRPEGSKLSFSGAATANLFLGSIVEEYTFEKFVRGEFLHKRQQEALETTGARPVYIQMLSGITVQISTTCGTSTPRPLTPDDGDLNNIYRRFDITRFTIKSLENTKTDTETLFNLSQQHKLIWERFNYRQELANSANVSINELETLQADNLSWITSSGLTMAGPALGSLSPINNMLIRSCTLEPVYEIPGASSSTLYQELNLVIESLTNVPDSQNTW